MNTNEKMPTKDEFMTAVEDFSVDFREVPMDEFKKCSEKEGDTVPKC